MNEFKKAGFTLLEVMIVTGIFTIAIGLSLTVLSSSRLSVNVTEAQIQSQEHVRKAMDLINRELHLSKADSVLIYTDLANPSPLAPAPITGAVVYFQLPLENPNRTLNLAGDGSLRWGSKDSSGAYTENQYNYYYLGGADGDQLFRGTSANPGGGTAGAGALISRDISALTLSRDNANSEVIEFTIIGETDSTVAPIRQTLRSRIKLRN